MIVLLLFSIKTHKYTLNAPFIALKYPKKVLLYLLTVHEQEVGTIIIALSLISSVFTRPIKHLCQNMANTLLRSVSVAFMG